MIMQANTAPYTQKAEHHLIRTRRFSLTLWLIFRKDIVFRGGECRANS